MAIPFATPPVMLDRLANNLRELGWASVSDKTGVALLVSRAEEIANTLGNVVHRRGKALPESVTPRPAGDAPARTLSHKFGLGPFPLHCDMAHWLVPCRYLVLACADTGSFDAPTVLLDTLRLQFSETEKLLTRSACFLVRNGRKSFYTSLIDVCRSFVRIDPGCMEPVSETAAEAMSLYSYERQRLQTTAFHWKVGDILVIDNWRVLHGRGNELPADLSRHLLRIYVQ
jgi:Taurine catabolism dioxygenase TauD, TfdA family